MSVEEGTFSYIAQPAHEANSDESKERRANYFLEKAQAITENINSCYKEHNVPKADLALINKLKMRRMHLIQTLCAEEGVPTLCRKREPTQQSCNVVTTATVEQTVSDDEDYESMAVQRQQESSFNEALEKLKAEVACLVE